MAQYFPAGGVLTGSIPAPSYVNGSVTNQKLANSSANVLVVTGELTVSGNPLTLGSSITLGLADISGLTPGSYTSANITVDSKGRITVVSNGSGSGVSTFQTSLSGLTPSTASSGAITLTGTLGATSGGTSQSAYTTGDILYASAANTLSKLPIGAANSILTVSSGVPTWSAAPPVSTYYRTMTLNTSTVGAVGEAELLWTDTISAGGGIAAPNNGALGRFTIPVTGLYRIEYGAYILGGDSQPFTYILFETLLVAPNDIIRAGYSSNLNSTTPSVFTGEATIQLNAGATFRTLVKNTNWLAYHNANIPPLSTGIGPSAQKWVNYLNVYLIMRT